MAAKSNRNNSSLNNRNSILNWIKKPWVQITGTIITISTIVGIGYSLGKYSQNIDCQLEKLQMNQTFNEKLQNEINRCNAIQLEYLEKKKDNIELLIKNLEKQEIAKNGRK